MEQQSSEKGFDAIVIGSGMGTFGSDQPGDKMLDLLSGEGIDFQSLGTVYDTLHFPDGFEIAVGRPAETYKRALRKRFPANAAEIDTYFEALRVTYTEMI